LKKNAGKRPQIKASQKIRSAYVAGKEKYAQQKEKKQKKKKEKKRRSRDGQRHASTGQKKEKSETKETRTARGESKLIIFGYTIFSFKGGGKIATVDQRAGGAESNGQWCARQKKQHHKVPHWAARHQEGERKSFAEINDTQKEKEIIATNTELEKS